MATTSDPTWVLLAPVSVRELERAIDDGPPGAQWRIVRGTGDYNALVDDEPGTEQSGERELSERWSAHGPCYAGYFDPPWISVCDKGRWVKEEEGDPYSLAASLGCPLRAEPEPEIPKDAIIFVVALGVTPEALARAMAQVIGIGWPSPPDDPLLVRAVPLGALAMEEGGDVIDSARSVSEKLGATVYTVEWLPKEPRLRVERIEHGVVTGLYDVPLSWWSEPMRMPDVLGESEPRRIVERLGVT